MYPIMNLPNFPLYIVISHPSPVLTLFFFRRQSRKYSNFFFFKNIFVISVLVNSPGSVLDARQTANSGTLLYNVYLYIYTWHVFSLSFLWPKLPEYTFFVTAWAADALFPARVLLHCTTVFNCLIRVEYLRVYS